MFRWFKLAKRVSELEDLMAKLARTVSDRELDWLDMRARCKRLLDRTEKAASRMESGVESDETQPAAPNGEGEAVPGFSLSPSQARLQQQILRRRAAKQ